MLISNYIFVRNNEFYRRRKYWVQGWFVIPASDTYRLGFFMS